MSDKDTKAEIEDLRRQVAAITEELAQWEGRVAPEPPPSAESQLSEQQLKIARAAGLSPERYLELYREQQEGQP